MATSASLKCTRCGGSHNVGNLLGALTEVRSRTVAHCAECSAPRELHLKFAFAFEAGGAEVVAAAVFAPRDEVSAGRRWSVNGHDIEYIPLLIILEDVRQRTKRSIWMPYWHTDTDNVTGRTRNKYGQWAPMMDEVLFLDLIDQAAAAGYTAAPSYKPASQIR